MKSYSPSLLLTLSLLSNPILQASTCKTPFEGREQSFLLQETLNCTKTLNEISLQIKDANQTDFSPLDDHSFFLKPECVTQNKVLNLYYNASQNYMVDWSNAVKDGIFYISLICEDHSIALLDTNLQKQIVASEEAIVSYTVYDLPNINPIAYVLESENDTNSLILRAPNGTKLASAEKTFHQSGNTCYANWKVDNGDLDPTILSYILAWKDNTMLKCTKPASSVSFAALIGVSALGLAGAFGMCGGVAYLAHRSGYERLDKDIVYETRHTKD